MAYLILKLNDGERDFYLEWSTHTDAPRTFGMTLNEFTAFYRDEYGRSSMLEFQERMERVEAKGTSDYCGESVDETIARNHAAKDGLCLTKGQIIKVYCHERQKPVTEEGVDPWAKEKAAEAAAEARRGVI
jgi:hypothetical protein